MFRLTLLLGAAIFLVLLIGGEDRGQLRPGLAAATQAAPAAAPEVAAAAAAVPAAAAASSPADIAPADIAAATAPVVVAAAPGPVIAPQPVAVGDEGVFSLATYAEPQPTAATPPATADAGTAGPVAIVDARSVNVRAGPGTGFAVVTRLSRGEAVTRIADAGEGWALIRIEGDGVEGYVSTRYLTAP